MDKDLARFIAHTMFKCTRELSRLIPSPLEEHCGREEFRSYVRAIAKVMGAAHDAVSRIDAEHPEIQREMSETIEKFGRLP